LRAADDALLFAKLSVAAVLFMLMKGTLYLLPVPVHPEGVHAIPPHNVTLANASKVVIAESIREARRNLRKMGCTLEFDAIQMFEWDKHNEINNNVTAWLQPVVNGDDGVLVSDAGCPAVADPGSTVVAAAHRLGIKVVPLTGPSSLLLALMGSGLNGQSFAFHGYLPVKSNERVARIKELELASQHNYQTQLFIETPYRSDALFQDLLKGLSNDTALCVATNLTAPNERITTRLVADWKRTNAKLDKVPAVFLFLKQ
jgi:16S rRNA (cytidine1402-2'-O)-methyltransferase